MLVNVCQTSFASGAAAAVLITVTGLLVRYRMILRNNKTIDFDRNQFLLTSLFVVASIVLVTFLAFVFFGFGRC